MPDHDTAMGALILTAQGHYNQARWWVLALVWVFGRHRIIRHLGRTGRVGFWRGQPYLLSFRDTP
jgi:hypothetical protein